MASDELEPVDDDGRPRELVIRRRDGLLVPTTGDPDDAVSAATDQQYWRGIPRTTQDVYTYQWNRRFVPWCSDDSKGPPWPRAYLPATVGTIREYINAHWTWTRKVRRGDELVEVRAGLNGQPYAPETVALALKVISIVHQGFGYASPTKHPDVKRQMRGYRQDWAKAGFRPDVADSITPDELLRMVATCDMEFVSGLRDALLLRLAFDCGRRNSELMALNWSGIKWIDDRRMLVTFPYSKTNQDAKDDTIGVEQDDEWAPGSDPVLLMREWRELCATRGLSVNGAAPVFRTVRTGQKAKVGISGVIVDERMTRSAYQDMVIMRAEASGVHQDPVTGDLRKIVPHSIRHAFASEGDRDGVPIHQLADRGGWARTSTVILGYMKTKAKWGEDNPAVRMRRAEVARREEEERRHHAAGEAS